jgi:hypothetical protein
MTDTDPFATPQQVEALTQGLVPASRPGLAQALDAATTKIRTFCGWHIARTRADTITINLADTQTLYLPTALMTALDSLTIDGIDIDIETDAAQWATDGRLWRPSWSQNYRGVVVGIHHGYAEVPADILDATLALAVGRMVSPLGATREQTLTSSVSWGTTTLDDLDVAGYKIGRIP